MWEGGSMVTSHSNLADILIWFMLRLTVKGLITYQICYAGSKQTNKQKKKKIK